VEIPVPRLIAKHMKEIFLSHWATHKSNREVTCAPVFRT